MGITKRLKREYASHHFLGDQLMQSYRFPTSLDNMALADQIYQSVGHSPFTGGIAAEIIGISAKTTGPLFGALRNAHIIEWSHETARKTKAGYMSSGNPVRWYRFTDAWHQWKCQREQAVV